LFMHGQPIFILGCRVFPSPPSFCIDVEEFISLG
jgi:hypothetical protein